MCLHLPSFATPYWSYHVRPARHPFDFHSKYKKQILASPHANSTLRNVPAIWLDAPHSWAGDNSLRTKLPDPFPRAYWGLGHETNKNDELICYTRIKLTISHGAEKAWGRGYPPSPPPHTLLNCFPHRFLAAPNPPGKTTPLYSDALREERGEILPRAILADSTRTFL